MSRDAMPVRQLPWHVSFAVQSEITWQLKEKCKKIE